MKKFLQYLGKHSWFFFALLLIIIYKFMDNVNVVNGGVKYFLSLLTPFFIGFALAYLAYPLAMKIRPVFQKSRSDRVREGSYSISVITAYAALLLVAVLILRFGLPAIYSSLMGLIQKIPEYYSQIVEFINNISTETNIFDYVDVSGIKKNINLNTIISMLNLADFSIYINNLWGIISFFVSLLMGLVIGAYFLLDKDDVLSLTRRIAGLFLNEERLDYAADYVKKINRIFYNFFYGISMEAVVVGIIAGICFYIFKIPFALVMALIVTVFNVIPYFGPFVAIVIIATVTLLTEGVFKALFIVVFLAVLNQIDGMFIGPKILGDSLKMSPLWVIFAIVIGGGYFGIFGMFLGIPVIAVFRMLLLDFLDHHEAVKREEINGHDSPEQ